MKIYFAGAIRGGRENWNFHSKLIQYLSKYGQVLTEHIGDGKLTELGETSVPDEKIYNRDMAWIKESDVVIADVSTPSLGVGYEISQAQNLGKKILCLYKNQPDKRLSAMISGNPNIKVVKYETLEDAVSQIDNYFKAL